MGSVSLVSLYLPSIIDPLAPLLTNLVVDNPSNDSLVTHVPTFLISQSELCLLGPRHVRFGRHEFDQVELLLLTPFRLPSPNRCP